MNQFMSRFDSSPSFGIEIVSNPPSLILISSSSTVDCDSEASERVESTRIKFMLVERRDWIDAPRSLSRELDSDRLDLIDDLDEEDGMSTRFAAYFRLSSADLVDACLKRQCNYRDNGKGCPLPFGLLAPRYPLALS